jgi:hypothetical protein
MPWGLERAKRYRLHAEKLRAMLGDLRDPDSRQQAAELASDFDRMAEELEQSAKADGPNPK